VLTDYLLPDLRLVICGTAVGLRSSTIGRYYAGKGNRLWQVLYETGITPVLLTPEEDRRALDIGVGFTDLVKQRAGADATLAVGDWDVDAFRTRIQQYQPKVVCFNGKRAAQAALCRKTVHYGFQEEKIGISLHFTAPSTSGAARGSWDKSYWQ
jgi:TDG/mug DNA glycosylase family protein